MARGTPDHFKGVILYAYNGSDFIPVLVDTDGQLYAILKGVHDSTPTAIKVTSTGELYAVLKAAYGGNLIDVLADSSGNLTLNLVAQDLSEIINRPKYGAVGGSTANLTCSAGVLKVLVLVAGKGLVYGGSVCVDETWNVNDKVYVYCDGYLANDIVIGETWNDGITFHRPTQLYITNYDTVTPRLNVMIGGGWTFETKLEVAYLASDTDREVTATAWYAIV